MKRLKALGLAAVAAMALTALLGASSASATVLCTTTTTPCGAGWHIDEFFATLTPGSTVAIHNTNGSLEATCTGSSSRATKISTGSATTTPVYTVTAVYLTWSGCNQVTQTLEGGEFEIHQIPGTHNGTVTARGFRVTANLGVSCVYTAGNGISLGDLTGGSPAILHLNAIVTRVEGGFLCPSTAVWTATYTITNHTAAYVVAE